MEKKAVLIQAILEKLYPHPPVGLNYNCAFTFLCAVVLSAQTTDGKVNSATKTLFQMAPTPSALAKLEPSQVQPVIQQVGLAPKKSAYLVGLAKSLVERHNGLVPCAYEDLEALPGVGHKTASVVRSHIFEIPSFAVDTHIHRLALRWNLSKEATNVDKVQKDLCAIFPESSWDKLHLRMIYFGREYCQAKGHVASHCPICSCVNNHEKLNHPETILANLDDYLRQYERPKAPHGNVILYHSRVEELAASPSIADEANLRKGAVIRDKCDDITSLPSPAPQRGKSSKGGKRKLEVSQIEEIQPIQGKEEETATGRREKQRRGKRTKNDAF